MNCPKCHRPQGHVYQDNCCWELDGRECLQRQILIWDVSYHQRGLQLEEVRERIRRLEDFAELAMPVLKDVCHHNCTYSGNNTETDQELSARAALATLIVDGSWECPTSPMGKCQYDDLGDPVHDECIHCGRPDERK